MGCPRANFKPIRKFLSMWFSEEGLVLLCPYCDSSNVHLCSDPHFFEEDDTDEDPFMYCSDCDSNFYYSSLESISLEDYQKGDY